MNDDSFSKESLEEHWAACIHNAETALAEWDEGQPSDSKAGIFRELSVCYCKLLPPDRGANLRKAIEYAEAALHIYTEAGNSLLLADIYGKLGDACMALSELTDTALCLRRAIAYQSSALPFYAAGRNYWRQEAFTHNKLAVCSESLPDGDRRENLACAIKHYEAMLAFYTKKDYPDLYSETQKMLANVRNELRQLGA